MVATRAHELLQNVVDSTKWMEEMLKAWHFQKVGERKPTTLVKLEGWSFTAPVSCEDPWFRRMDVKSARFLSHGHKSVKDRPSSYATASGASLNLAQVSG